MNQTDHVEIILGLGSNLGDREANLASVLLELPPEVLVRDVSSIYRTTPWGYYDQPDFYNQVISASTTLTPRELLGHLKQIEKRIGRTPTFRYGPRQVDIDILFYGDQVVEEEDLVIPHPRLEERAFVLIPLQEIMPDLILPLSERPIADRVEEIGRSGVELLGD